MGGESDREIRGIGEKKEMKTNKYCLLIIALKLLTCSLLLTGCGYTTRSMIAEKFKSIYVQPFVNKIDISREADSANKYKTNKPMLETDITNSVVNRFLWDGNLRPVAKEAADLILKGELVEFRRDPLRYTQDDEVEEYRINLVVNIILLDNRENKVLWKEVNFTGDTTYFTRGTLAKSEDLAINDALVDLSRRIVERVIEEW